jgi:hypothetical protein
MFYEMTFSTLSANSPNEKARVFEKKQPQQNMSLLGPEFLTEIGEFLEFNTITKDDREHHEDFVDWIPLADIDPTHTPTFTQTRHSVIQTQERMRRK